MTRDRAKGCLWGLIVGDCLGSPIQFTDKDDHPWITEMEPCAIFHTPPGYWTDDTSMALCIMESFIRNRGCDLRDIAANFVRWFRDGAFSSLPRAFDVGGATATAVFGIERGSLKNGDHGTQGNGSLMRFAPSYFIARKRNDPAICFEISDLTHASSVVREIIGKMYAVVDEHLAGRAAKPAGVRKERKDVVNSGWVVSTFDAAMWAFAAADTFEEGMIQAVNLGGDADTIGAVYGQIAGAYYGFSGIPERWLAAIKDRAYLDGMIETFLDLTIGG